MKGSQSTCIKMNIIVVNSIVPLVVCYREIELHLFWVGFTCDYVVFDINEVNTGGNYSLVAAWWQRFPVLWTSLDIRLTLISVYPGAFPPQSNILRNWRSKRYSWGGLLSNLVTKKKWENPLREHQRDRHSKKYMLLVPSSYLITASPVYEGEAHQSRQWRPCSDGRGEIVK